LRSRAEGGEASLEVVQARGQGEVLAQGGEEGGLGRGYGGVGGGRGMGEGSQEGRVGEERGQIVFAAERDEMEQIPGGRGDGGES
jgi:hypothetical protein